MKKSTKKLFTLLLLSVCSHIIYCQSSTSMVCGAQSMTYEENRTLQMKLLALKSNINNKRIASNGINYLPIKPIILRTSSGTGGISIEKLNNWLYGLNKYFINAEIQFFFCSSPVYINNDNFYYFHANDQDILCSQYDVSTNAINLYIPKTIDIAAGFTSSNITDLGRSNRIFISEYCDSETTVHEFGHWFSLLHTHNGNLENSTRELVARPPSANANCSTTGDFICDTNADPYSLGEFYGCLALTSITDANNMYYRPPYSNIMSYYGGQCTNDKQFTLGQYSRIKDGYLLRINPTNQYNLNCGGYITGTNAPSNLSAILNSNSTISLNFTDNTTEEMGYIIERSLVSPTEGFVVIAGLSPNQTSFIDNYISGNVQYYRVKASNSSTYYSNTISIQTPCLNSISITESPKSSTFYKSNNLLSTSNTINNGSVVTYQAANQVRLLPGFKVYEGSTFRAKIAGCNVASREGLAENSVKEVENKFLAFPNPAKDVITFEYEVNEGFTELTLYNLMGSQVAKIVNNTYHQKGRYQVVFNTGNINSGVFLYTLKTNGQQNTKRITIIK